VPRGDGTGPIGRGARDGRGRRFGGRGQSSSQRGSGAMTGRGGGRGGNQSFLGSWSHGGFLSRIGNFFQQFNSRGKR